MEAIKERYTEINDSTHPIIPKLIPDPLLREGDPYLELTLEPRNGDSKYNSTLN